MVQFKSMARHLSLVDGLTIDSRRVNGKSKSKWEKIENDSFIAFFSAVTEVWDFESGDNEIIEPILPRGSYAGGIALFEVDAYFCNI